MTALALLAKSVVVLLMGSLLAAALRRNSAACRYIVWVITLAAALLLPVGGLLPGPSVKFAMSVRSGLDAHAVEFIIVRALRLGHCLDGWYGRLVGATHGSDLRDTASPSTFSSISFQCRVRSAHDTGPEYSGGVGLGTQAHAPARVGVGME